MTMTRKDFLRTLVGAGVGAAGVAALAGCGGDDGGGSPDAAPANPTCATSSTVIASNHGHTMMVSMADADAAANKTYDIMGSAPHSHSVTITAAQFGMLKMGQTLSLNSTSGGTDGHTHTVTVMCTT